MSFKCELVQDEAVATRADGDRGRRVRVVQSPLSTTSSSTSATAANAATTTAASCTSSDSGCVPEGELLLTASPFAKVLATECWLTHCAACFQTPAAKESTSLSMPSSLSRCGKCRVAQYCSRDCQKNDWQAHHRRECKVQPQLWALRQQLSSDQIAEVLLLARVARRQKQQQLKQTSRSARGNKLTSLVPRDLSFYEQDLTPEIQLLAALTQKLGLVDESESLEDLGRLLCRFGCNNFLITDDLMQPIGSGCFPMGAMVNHSCQPNSVVAFEPRSGAMQFRAIRPIRFGEELTQTYVDIAWPRSRRQALLLRQYHFACQCSRCSTPMETSTVDFQLEADAEGNLPSKWSAARCHNMENSRKLLERMTQQPKADESERIQRLSEVFTMRQQELGEFNFERFEVTSQLFSALMDAGAFAKALNPGLAMLRFYELVYGANHPMKALHLFTLGDLSAHLASLSSSSVALLADEAKTFFQEARRILALCQGPKAPLVAQLDQRLSGSLGQSKC